LKRAVTLSPPAKNEIVSLLHEVASDIVFEAESLAVCGDLWEFFLALRLAEDENSLGRAAELAQRPSGSVVKMAASELWFLHKIIATARDIVENGAEYEGLRCLKNYEPSGRCSSMHRNSALGSVSLLAQKFGQAETPGAMTSALLDFYTSQGSGVFSLNRAFIWSRNAELLPVEPDTQTFSGLLGYEEQKAALIANTRLFLNGRAANNVLLFGDSGTGKSSSVKALLNEPDFQKSGLRMIEIKKDQLADIMEIIRRIRDRNYRFILFLDDLSFEEYEVEYKHLKALIEGGIERKPDNVVIYATSNRRNIVREVWKDRRTSNDDVHGWDTMQEKLSLADRFGVMIWYGAVDKDRYLEIAKHYANEYGLSIPKEELEALAMRWEIGKGGFSGRTARQFAQHLLTGEEIKG
jgi:predicted AAA+ superfamily ATPase